MQFAPRSSCGDQRRSALGADQSSEERLKRRPRQLVLRYKTAGATARHHPAELAGVTAGRQHHGRSVVPTGEAGGHVEAIEVRELNVEQHDGRAHRVCRGQS